MKRIINQIYRRFEGCEGVNEVKVPIGLVSEEHHVGIRLNFEYSFHIHTFQTNTLYPTLNENVSQDTPYVFGKEINFSEKLWNMLEEMFSLYLQKERASFEERKEYNKKLVVCEEKFKEQFVFENNLIFKLDYLISKPNKTSITKFSSRCHPFDTISDVTTIHASISKTLTLPKNTINEVIKHYKNGKVTFTTLGRKVIKEGLKKRTPEKLENSLFSYIRNTNVSHESFNLNILNDNTIEFSITYSFRFTKEAKTANYEDIAKEFNKMLKLIS